MNYRSARTAIIMASILGLAACGPHIRPGDSAPRYLPTNISKVKQPTPAPEPYSKYGNPASYQVNGKTYYPLKSNYAFTQSGKASWYGTKFHGRRTSSGETYDMFALTAAHKRLPIPSYVRVTNRENNKSIVVRVNDRGPFHDDRIIDLSYAAAFQLGYADKGTAEVDIEAISFEKPPVQAVKVATPNREIFIQAGAFSDRGNAENLKQRLAQYALQAKITTSERQVGVYRVYVGPLGGREQADEIQNLLNQIGIQNAKLIKTATLTSHQSSGSHHAPD